MIKFFWRVLPLLLVFLYLNKQHSNPDTQEVLQETELPLQTESNESDFHYPISFSYFNSINTAKS